MIPNIYLDSVERALPRLLSLFDQDVTSTTYGYGDRYHWAWGLIDFANGTYQGAAHGLARLLRFRVLPKYISQEEILSLIESQFVGSAHMIRSDGSLEEAFPFEGSFCVTALVAYDLCVAIDLLEPLLTEKKKNEYIECIRPLIGFITHNDETHAIISNHLATAVAALSRWESLTGEDTSARTHQLLAVILDNQSCEGWYMEYEGFDPGYMSLCLYYLADVWLHSRDKNLKCSLDRALKFLRNFIHPDGTFGGEYGSRNTRFYFPAAFEALSELSEDAAFIASCMRKSIEDYSVVGLDAIDESNLIPMFNAYCWAAVEANDSLYSADSKEEQYQECYFTEAGIFVKKTPRTHTIVSTHKGGVVFHFVDDNLVVKDVGVAVVDSSNKWFSTQCFNQQNLVKFTGNTITITSQFSPMLKQVMTPLKFVSLRLLCISVMRFRVIREWIKRVLVNLLISGQNKSIGKNVRVITIADDFKLVDTQELPKGYQVLDIQKAFVPIHMASKGYWQKS